MAFKGKGVGKRVKAPVGVVKPAMKIAPAAQKPVKKEPAPAAPARVKIEKGEKDDPDCWELAQTGKCPRFPCKWAPCCDTDVSDPMFEGARITKKYAEENNIDAEAFGLKLLEPRPRRERQKKGKAEKPGNNNAKNNTAKPQQQKKQQKGKGKNGKKEAKEKKPKEPLVGPNGEAPDDATCWEVKTTGLCPRFPCKWQPCADLPQDDPIFSEAKVRKPREKRFKKQFKEEVEA